MAELNTATFAVTFSDDGTEVVGLLSDDAPDIKPMRHNENDEKITDPEKHAQADSRVTLQMQLNSFARGYFAEHSFGGPEAGVVEYTDDGIAVGFRDNDAA